MNVIEYLVDVWNYTPQFGTKNPYHTNRVLCSMLLKFLIFFVIAFLMVSYTIFFVILLPVFHAFAQFDINIWYLALGSILGLAISQLYGTVAVEKDTVRSRYYSSIRALLFYVFIFLFLQGVYMFYKYTNGH